MTMRIVSVVSLMLLTLLVACGGASGDGDAGAGEVDVVESGAEGRERLGVFSESEAIRTAEDVAGFSLSVPAEAPDPRLTLAHIQINRPAPDLPTANVVLQYLPEHESAEVQLMVTTFPPGSRGEVGGTQDGVETVNVGDRLVRVETHGGEPGQRAPEAQFYQVVDGPLHVIAVGVPQDAVLAMIGQLLASMEVVAPEQGTAE